MEGERTLRKFDVGLASEKVIRLQNSLCEMVLIGHRSIQIER